MISRLIFLPQKKRFVNLERFALPAPGQSGKTTLSKKLFAGKPYVNFENPDVQKLADESPRAFLHKYRNGAVFDEVQRVPHIFRYLQGVLDNNNKRGQFILTG